MNREYHVVPMRPKGWSVVWSGVRELYQVPTQREAWERAKGYAFQAMGEAVLHGRDGRIRDSWRYQAHGGNDASDS